MQFVSHSGEFGDLLLWSVSMLSLAMRRSASASVEPFELEVAAALQKAALGGFAASGQYLLFVDEIA